MMIMNGSSRKNFLHEHNLKITLLKYAINLLIVSQELLCNEKNSILKMSQTWSSYLKLIKKVECLYNRGNVNL